MIDCLIYFAVFAVVFILNYMAIRQKNPGLKKFLIITGFLILLAFIGFRYNVGTDYDSYLKSYTTISEVSWSKLPSLRTELLVASIFKLCSYILWDARLIFVVLGFLMLWPIYKINKLYDYKYLAYSVLIYCVLFLPFGLNGMRQGIAMGFAMLSLVYMYRKKIKNGLISFVLAVLLHTSSLIILPYLVLIYFTERKNIKFSVLNLLLTAFISVAVLFFLNNFLLENGFSQYDYILGKINIERMSLNGAIMYAPILLLTLILRNNGIEKKEYSITKGLTISGAIFSIVGTAAQYLSRFSLFFLMPSIVLVPQLIQSIPKKNIRIILKCLLFIYLLIFFYVQYSLWGKHEILPYQTWIFGGTT